MDAATTGWPFVEPGGEDADELHRAAHLSVPQQGPRPGADRLGRVAGGCERRRHGEDQRLRVVVHHAPSSSLTAVTRRSKTSDYSFGGAAVFPSDNYGPEVNGPDDFPMPKTPAANVAMINRTGAMLHDVFTEAHRLGMKTCVGTESPLDIPDTVEGAAEGMGPQPRRSGHAAEALRRHVHAHPAGVSDRLLLDLGARGRDRPEAVRREPRNAPTRH